MTEVLLACLLPLQQDLRLLRCPIRLSRWESLLLLGDVLHLLLRASKELCPSAAPTSGERGGPPR